MTHPVSPFPAVRRPFRPSLSLRPADVLPGGAVTYRLPFENPLFGRSDLHTDLGLGGMNQLMGGLGLAAHESAWTPQQARLFRQVGFELPARVVTYRDRASYREALRTLRGEFGPLVTMFPQHPADLPVRDAALPPDLLTELADKARLSALTACLPPRRVTPNEPDAVRAVAAELGGAVVVKASFAPTGGGADVVFCADPQEAAAAAARYPAGAPLVLETRLHLESSPSVQVVVRGPGDVTVLGVTVQRLVGARFSGVELRPLAREAGCAALGAEVALACAARGFRGVLGVDLMDPGAGAPLLVAEVNPRLTGGTLAALLGPALRAHGLQARLEILTSTCAPDTLSGVLLEGWQEGRAVPMLISHAAPWGGTDRAGLMLLGESAAELDGQAAWFAARLRGAAHPGAAQGEAAPDDRVDRP
ncbi:hypothetical protein [Deinococcus aquaticus]|uniref:hypothetical protein n=1 Tax=Deinococcus aquaticus TaxID=328692 RepID=UPI003F45A26C